MLVSGASMKILKEHRGYRAKDKLLKMQHKVHEDNMRCYKVPDGDSLNNRL